MEEDYEMVPHNEILKLKKEVDELKSTTGSEIKNVMQELTDSINNMNKILKTAAEGMKAEESEASNLSNKLDSLIEKLGVVVEENKKIAESMITLAQLIKKRFPIPQPKAAFPQRLSGPSLVKRTMPPEPMPRPRTIPPQQGTEKRLPPLPPAFEKEKRRGLFEKLMK